MRRTTERHPSDGTLRRLVDEPAGVADADREHVAGCPACLSGLAAAQRDATAAAAALGTGGPAGTGTDAAWHRLSAAVAAGRPRPAAAPRRRWALRRPLVAGLGVVVVLAGGGVAAAGDWLQVFRTEQVAPVTVTQADLVALPDLTAYGEVEVLEEPDVREVPDAAAAEAATGLSVPEVAELPRGVTGEPSYQAGGRISAVFTFSAEQAAQAAAEAGEQLPPPPPGLDGGQFRLTAGPGVAAVWPSANGVPALVVARAGAPTGESSGIPFATARDYLLSLPGIPEDLAAQLRGFGGAGTTLPLPVPAGLATSEPADVDGAPATVLTSRDGLVAGVVWVEDGVVTAVAGSLGADEVLAVARGLDG
ncbi:hypothetical protein SAMN05660464_0814 [Geodermatophilus dictyosporus]|uniref:Uncharacterized protein n=1 Tax=Geodermatophilus dictyosporus TaxID=1523247 RepID=A0A1I5JK17_9ACTN|nr:hypothetical protein [Geodermatophilus dictyosporus]SFO73132.1 hypothetical protein SAMN05660464_0814 [Geodermatophilus dictyosporus]